MSFTEYALRQAVEHYGADPSVVQIKLAAAIQGRNFTDEGIIDPGDSHGVYSSHQFSKQYGDTRDLYITYLAK